MFGARLDACLAHVDASLHFFSEIRVLSYTPLSKGLVFGELSASKRRVPKKSS